MQDAATDPSAPEPAPDARPDGALAAAAATDREAFEQLYLRHRLGLFRYARARVDDDEAAADLVSLTFERALASIDRYRSVGGGFRAWLFRIARNEVIDASRRRATAARNEPNLRLIVAAAPDPAEEVIRAESLVLIRALVATLPDTQRDAVLLRYAGGLTAREIALTLGRSEAAVQKLITRALARLKEDYRAGDR